MSERISEMSARFSEMSERNIEMSERNSEMNERNSEMNERIGEMICEMIYASLSFTVRSHESSRQYVYSLTLLFF